MRWLGISASSSFQPFNRFLLEHRFFAVANAVNFNDRKGKQQEYNGKQYFVNQIQSNFLINDICIKHHTVYNINCRTQPFSCVVLYG